MVWYGKIVYGMVLLVIVWYGQPLNNRLIRGDLENLNEIEIPSNHKTRQEVVWLFTKGRGWGSP